MADVDRMIVLSLRAMANIRATVFIALSLKAVPQCTTALGITGLWPAILADIGAAVLATADALRIFWTGM